MWSIILIAYLVYRRKRPDLHAPSSYRLRWGVPLSWVVLGFFAAMIVVLALFEDTRLPLLWTPLWFVGLAVAWWFVKRRHDSAAEPDAAMVDAAEEN